MRPLILLAVFAIALAGSTRSAEITKGPMKAGQNLPGSFHPYNVNARIIPPEELEEADREEKDKEKDEEKHTTKGKFHCLVTEYDLNPVVMLIARGLDDSEGFKELLKKLDAAIANNRLRRLRAFVVFLDDSLKNVVTEDDPRVELAKKAQKIIDDLKLENVVLTLAGVGGEDKMKNVSKADLAKYQPDSSAPLTAVLYKNLKIQTSHTFKDDELAKADSPAVKTILEATAKMLKPK
jgi:hypothetical protein